MSALFIPPEDRPLSPLGLTLPFAKRYFYLTGTTTAADVYDADGDVIAQPVVADVTGAFVDIYLDPAVTYRSQLKTSEGVILSDVDPYPTVFSILSGPLGASFIGTSDGGNVQEALDSFINYADPYAVTGATALGRGQLNRYIVCTGTSANYTCNLPPVGSSDVGAAVYIDISNACTKLVTVAAAVASGILIDGASSRIMHADESAMLVYDGTQWIKLFGKSVPFSGYIEASAGLATPAIGSWTAVPMTVAGGDTRQASGSPAGLTPWFSTDHIVIPRRSNYAFDLQLQVNNITMPTPDFTAPFTTEFGAEVRCGIGYSGNNPTDGGSLFSGRVLYSQSLGTVAFSEIRLLGASTTVTPYIQPLSPLTAIDVAYSSPSTISRLSFTEIVSW